MAGRRELRSAFPGPIDLPREPPDDGGAAAAGIGLPDSAPRQGAPSATGTQRAPRPRAASRAVRQLRDAQRMLLGVSLDALERCRRTFAWLERNDPATSPIGRDPDTAPGGQLPDAKSPALAWYREASRAVLGMTEAQLRRDRNAIDARKLRPGPGDVDATAIDDAELIAGLVASLPDHQLQAELARRGIGAPIDAHAVERADVDGGAALR